MLTQVASKSNQIQFVIVLSMIHNLYSVYTTYNRNSDSIGFWVCVFEVFSLFVQIEPMLNWFNWVQSMHIHSVYYIHTIHKQGMNNSEYWPNLVFGAYGKFIQWKRLKCWWRYSSLESVSKPNILKFVEWFMVTDGDPKTIQPSDKI